MPRETIEVAPATKAWLLQQIKIDQLNPKLWQQVEQWRLGEKALTFHQLENLSKASRIPLGYFFLQNPPREELPLLEYRTVDSLELQRPSRELIDTVQNMEDIQAWMRDYLKDAGFSPLTFVGSQRQTLELKAVVAAMLEELGLSHQWYREGKCPEDLIKLLRRKAEYAGILVMSSGIVGANTHRQLSVDEFRAFTLLDNYAPLIFLNTADSANGRLFSLVHEMAHIWVGVNSLFNDSSGTASDASPLEQRCNAIAGEFLVPDKDFVSIWNKQSVPNSLLETVSKIADYFHCGQLVIARKALDHGFILNTQYGMLARAAIDRFQDKQRDKNGGDFYRSMGTRLDHRFFNALVNSVQEGRTSDTEALRLTHTSRSTFAQLADEMRGW